MSSLRLLPVAAALVLSQAAAAQFTIPLASDARVTSIMQILEVDRRIDIAGSDLPGTVTALVAAFDEQTIETGPWPILVPIPVAPDGTQHIQATFPADTDFEPGTKLYVRNLVLQPNGTIATTNTTVLALGAAPCITFDFDTTPGGPLLQGEFVAEQWASLGLHIWANNNQIGHPDKVIAFDSSLPSIPDPDLQTPGVGVNNDTPLGMLLIIPQDEVDVLPPFGYVDVPNDENKGGQMYFDFDAPVTLCGMKVVDIDDPTPSFVRFFSGAVQIGPDVVIPNLGNNSVHDLQFYMQDVTRMVMVFAGSGGIASFEIEDECPITTIDFDSDADGDPLNLPAGLEITTQLDGVTVSAVNNNNNHPDRAILFDTANPTGGDTDLATPGTHATNNLARGMVLIIAENDIGIAGDGIVDNPDDESAGGILRLVFDADRTFRSATVLDIDAGEPASIELFDAGGAHLGSFPFTPLGNNSIETVVGDVDGVRRLELHMTGSGALADVSTCPDHD